jgi:nitrate reductase alpha subunit
VLTGGHTRWSIHAAWRDSETMLRLHRGAPFLLMAAEDAAARGIADGDRVRVRNAVGEFEVRAKLAPQLRPGQTILYHAWEDFQFRGGKSHNHLTPSPLNPVELAGGHPHLTYAYNFATPGQFDRETRIEVERLDGEGAA